MPRVLIVEENSKLAELIRNYLQRKGLDSDIAADGMSALRSFVVGAYDLLLVDMKLARMAGDDVCRKIRQSSKGRSIPIIMMSGVVKEQSDIETLKKELSLSGYLPKPFSSESLYSMISSSLSGAPSAHPATGPQKTVQKPHPSVKGELEKTPFEQVLSYLMKKRATGTLTLARETLERGFCFIDGAPVELERSSEDDDFGHYLRQKNLVDDVELREYEDRKKKDGEDVRDIFVKMGCLEPLRFQEENRFYLNDKLIDCFSWRKGTFSFEWGSSFVKSFHSASASLPHIFFKGFKTHLSHERISSFVEGKRDLYIGKTAEFFEYQYQLSLDAKGLEVFDLIDGLKSCSEIMNSIEVEEESAFILYTLDHLKMLSYSRPPQKTAVTAVFPIRERKAAVRERKEEKFEDIGGELSELGDELEGLGEMKAPQATAAETQELNSLEWQLRKKWEEIKDKNYYEMFGLTPNSFSFDKLKKSYFEYTKRYGPDKFFASSSEVMGLAEELLSKVSNAFNTLSNVVSKENYDEILSSQEKAPTNEEEKEFHEQIQFQSGKVFLEQGQYESAEKAFINCMNANPDKPEYQAYLAVAIYNNPANRGNPTAVKRAKDMVNKSLQFGKLSIAYALKGTMLLDEGSLNLAEAEFNKALKLNPNNKTALKKMEFIKEKREESKKGLFQKMFK